MQMNGFKRRVVEIVESTQGIKGVELSARLAVEFLSLTNEDMMSQIFDLIYHGEIVEIEYELPTMNYRTKSFLLPKGTVINVVKR